MEHSKKLLDQVRDVLRLKHYSIRTEESYVDWIRRYILFHAKRHPKDMGRAEVEAFLTHLAVEGNVAASTQNQAFSALLFLYREVLKIELDAPLDAIRAKKPARLPVVLTRAEAHQVIDGMTGTYQLMAKLLREAGSGLRLMECVRLRVKDVDFERREIVVRDAKGGHERVTMLSASLVAPLQEHLKRVKQLHTQDLAEGCGEVYLPYALDRKYPNASREWREAGNTSSRPTGFLWTRVPAASAAITWTKAIFNAPSKMLCAWPASPNPPVVTPFGTALPRTCSKAAMTSAPSKNSSATRTSRRR